MNVLSKRQRHLQQLLREGKFLQVRALIEQEEGPSDPREKSMLVLAYDQYAVTSARSQKRRAHLLLHALRIADRALRRFPTNAELYHVRGIVRLHRRESVEALADFRRAHRLSRRAAYLVSIGNALRQQSRYQEALAAYRRARRGGRKLHQGMLAANLARTYLALKQYGNARRAISSARQALRRRHQLLPIERQILRDLKVLEHKARRTKAITK